MRHTAPQQFFKLLADPDPHAVEEHMQLAFTHFPGRPFGDRRTGCLLHRSQSPQLTLALEHPQRPVHLQQHPVQTDHDMVRGFFTEII